MPRIRINQPALPGERWRRTVAFVVASAALGAPCAVDAQILRSPIPIPLPTLPPLSTPLGLEPSLRDSVQAVSPQRLETLRIERLRDLVRAHADVLELDPHGAAIVRNEIIALLPSPAGLAQAAQLGFSIGRRSVLVDDQELVVLVAPPKLGTRAALKEMRRADPAGSYDFNHVYVATGIVERAVRAAAPASDAGRASPGSSRVGLIDAGIDAGHPVFAGVMIHRWGCANAIVPSAHGTAVASLLAGRGGDFRGAVPGADIYGADVYCGAPAGGAVDAIVGAMAWMLRERVPVVNVSLVGPPNGVLGQVVQLLLTRGAIVVAAVGNDGPAAPPAYPASYPGVIAVTAVDAKRRLLLEAGRALHVDLAAPGADMLAAALPDGFAAVRGTSFAAPLVAGLLARELRSPDALAARAAIEHLEAAARAPAGSASALRYGKGVVGEALPVPVPGESDGRNPAPRSF